MKAECLPALLFSARGNYFHKDVIIINISQYIFLTYLYNMAIEIYY